MSATLQPAPAGIRLLHVDADLLVTSKPAGLLSVPGRGADKQDCLSGRVAALYPDALIVHRLDQATSGLLLMARTPAMQRELGALFESRRMSKHYVAVVEGSVRGEHGLIELPLMADWPNRPRQKVDAAQGKPARTRWQVLQRDPGQRWTRLALMPETGRTHQLRVHLQAIGHPILGDRLYGADDPGTESSRLLLHAWTLGFSHPVSGAALAFEDPPPF